MSEWNHHPWKPGDLVLYYSTPRHVYGAVVASQAWELGSGDRVVKLRGLGPEYVRGTGRNASTVTAYAGALRPAPTEFVDGQWVLPGEHEPAAVVTYAIEPSPETGHVGWCWWARGDMGDAPSYEQAKAAAEAALGQQGERDDD